MDITIRFNIDLPAELFSVRAGHIVSFLDPRYKRILFENNGDTILKLVRDMYFNIKLSESIRIKNNNPSALDMLLGSDSEDGDEFDEYLLQPQILYNLEADNW